MNSLPYPIIVKLIIEWPAIAFINRYTYRIYKKYVKDKGYVTVEYYLNPCNKTLNNMCKKGKYIEIPKDDLNWNYGLYGACKGGYLNLIKLMIEKGADNWNEGLSNACRVGNIDIVKLMIEKGADNWNEGLSYACRRVYLNLMNLMIEMGADKCYNCYNKKHNF